MKRSPFGASSRWPERATVVTSLSLSIECRNTFRIVPSSVLMLSMNTTSFAWRNSLNSPGVSSDSSSRDSSWRSYSSRRCLGPRRQPQRKHDDRQQERRGEPEYRLEPGGQALAGGKPDDHLAVAIPARQRQQHGQEQRDRQEDVEVEERIKAQKGQNAFGSHGSAGGAGQQPQHQIGEEYSQQDQKQPDRCRGQFSHQAAPEHHDDGNILTFSGRFADNADRTA